jgi:predicted 3-demethylubiquinone-9 3-methyltransferase (glyoxalase superfamily)
MDAKTQISTFLTFQQNDAEEAMNFYVSLFEKAKVLEVHRYGKQKPPQAKEGSVMMAKFELNGAQFICSDSFVKHEWNFTPAVSIYVECKTSDEVDRLYEKLSENGRAFMPLDNYGFSSKFGWVEDRFGVSWQLNLP